VQDILIEYRAKLYAGRGPGISEDEWRANTSLRPTVGGVPTAVSREELHLQTLRARGQAEEAAAEAAWAGSQFAVPPDAFQPPPAGPPQPPTRLPGAG